MLLGSWAGLRHGRLGLWTLSLERDSDFMLCFLSPRCRVGSVCLRILGICFLVVLYFHYAICPCLPCSCLCTLFGYLPNRVPSFLLALGGTPSTGVF